MSKHTPGPWKFLKTMADYRVTAPEAGDMICDASNEANARLVAAAPELLERLKYRAKHCPHRFQVVHIPDKDCVECETDYALIAKAEGGAS